MRIVNDLKKYLINNEDNIFGLNGYIEKNEKKYYYFELKYIQDICNEEWQPKLKATELILILRDYYQNNLYFIEEKTKKIKKIKIDENILYSFSKYLAGFIVQSLNLMSKNEIKKFFIPENIIFLNSLFFKYDNLKDIFDKRNQCFIEPNYLKKLNYDDLFKIIINYLDFSIKTGNENLDFIKLYLDARDLKIDNEKVDEFLKLLNKTHKESIKKEIIELLIKYSEFESYKKIYKTILKNVDKIEVPLLILFLNKLGNNKSVLKKFFNELDNDKDSFEKIVDKLDKKTFEKIVRYYIDEDIFFSTNTYLFNKDIFFDVLEKMVKMLDENIIEEYLLVMDEYYNFSIDEITKILVILGLYCHGQ